MEFDRLANTLDQVSQTTKRKQKVAIVAQFLRNLDPTEIESASLFLAGKVFPESSEMSLNISWRGLLNALKELTGFTDDQLSEHYNGDVGEAIATLLSSKQLSKQSVLFQESLTIKRIFSVFIKIAESSGSGSTKEKQSLIRSLFVDASPREARYLIALILNDMRTGLSEGLLVDCISEAFTIDSNLVRRAWSFTGNIGHIAKVSAIGGAEALQKIHITIMIPVKPMLASPVDDLETAVALGPLAYELKLDGARVQIHKFGKEVRIFSRRLNDVTESMPDIVKLVNEKIKPDKVILDGEVVAVAEDGTPFPFQIVMRRFGRSQDVDQVHREIRLELYLFDILLLNDEMTIDKTYNKRRNILEENVPIELLVENLVTQDLDRAKEFFDKTKTMGHEGVLAKKIDSTYSPGVRGKNWLKIKHNLETLDLVIIAAERGHGRRSKWYSDYHLAVRDENSNEFMMIGKTFKGLTDAEFEEMTRKLEQIQVSKSRGIIRVRPEIVVEVLASEVQESPTYKSGMTLRFARIVNIRPDKGLQDVTTLSELRDIYDKQFRFKAR